MPKRLEEEVGGQVILKYFDEIGIFEGERWVEMDIFSLNSQVTPTTTLLELYLITDFEWCSWILCLNCLLKINQLKEKIGWWKSNGQNIKCLGK